MNVYQRLSPKQVTSLAPDDCFKTPSRSDGLTASPLAEGSPRRRHFSGSTPRPPSIFNGIRNLVQRQRSESLNIQALKKPLRKVQIAGCKLDSVYDLREDHDEDAETSDLYDDDRAFRRPRSNSSDFLILRKTSRPLSVDVVGLVDTMHDPYRQYMKVVDCYELAPHKNEVIIVDTQLSVIKAFEAMCDNQVGAILVWDREKGALTSIVTLSDFLHHVQRADAVGAMDSPVATILSGNQLVALNSDTKIFNACEEFTANKVHRLVICDPQTGDVHYLLTIKRVLQAIHRQNRSLPFAQWLGYPIKETGIGEWSNDIHKVSMDDDLSKAVEMLLGFRVSSLPVVDKDGVAVDVLHKADIAMSIYGQEDPKSFISGSTVKEILPPRPQPFFAQETTRVSECLDNMLNCRHTRCLFIVNERGEPTACVSLSDFLTHMLYSGKPFENSKSFSAQRSAEIDIEAARPSI
ncbi:unnamed protein product, partial [Mesorhabditis spiculigera]